MKREFLQSFKVGDQSLPKDIIDAIMEKNGQDIQVARQGAQDWEDKYNRAVSDHQKAMAEVRLESALQTAVTKAGGRNVKAIAALLDLETISQSQELNKAMEEALDLLRQDHGYLFEAPTPPPYARNTGAGGAPAGPVTLAGALRERINKG